MMLKANGLRESVTFETVSARDAVRVVASKNDGRVWGECEKIAYVGLMGR